MLFVRRCSLFVTGGEQRTTIPEQRTMFSKYFTPEEANKRLPLVKQIVGDIFAKAAEIKALNLYGNDPSKKPAYEKAFNQVNNLIEELESLGCFYKDWNFEKGLVDFPAMIEGEEVFLCWHSDEPDVRWYHSVEEGFPGRRPIPEYLLGNSDKKISVDSKDLA